VLEHAWRCPPPVLPEHVPPVLAEVVRQAMSRDPAQRFSSMTALRGALEGALRRRQATHLVSAANQHLRDLEAEVAGPTPSRERVSAALASCRFGFLEVLHVAPDDAEARAGLERAIAVATRFELAQRNLGGVRALLAELPRVPAELERAAEALEEAQEYSQVRRQHLAKLAEQENPAQARGERSRLFAALIAAVVVVTFLSTKAPIWTTWFGADHLLGRLLPTGLVLAGVVWLERRQLLSTRINRRLAAFQGACLAGLLFNRVVLTRLGLDVPAVLTADLVMLTMAAVTIGLTMHWGFFVSAAFLAIGALACLAIPTSVETLFGVFASLAYASVILTWARWRSDFEVPSPT
jgi:serine/threonine-protein kinase